MSSGIEEDDTIQREKKKNREEEEKKNKQEADETKTQPKETSKRNSGMVFMFENNCQQSLEIWAVFCVGSSESCKVFQTLHIFQCFVY